MPDTPPPIDRTDERLDALRELRMVGMAVARAVGRLAETAADEAEEAKAEDRPGRRIAQAGELSLAFARVSRAVRLTVALEERVEQGVGAPARAAVEAIEAARRAVDAEEGRRRANVAGIAQDLTEAVEDLIEDVAFGNEAAGDRLYEDLVDRVDALDDGALQDRPMVELVACICADLGLEPDWDLWADEDWIEDAGGLRAAKLAWKRAAADGATASVAAAAPMLEARPP